MEKLPTPNAPLGEVEYRTILLDVPVNADLERFIWGALAGISFWTSWIKVGSATVEDVTQEIKKVLNSRREAKFMIGQVVAYLDYAIPDNVLLLDGASYAKADYPLLWDALPVNTKDATSFTLPNVQGSFLLGASLDYDPLVSGGQSEVTLTIDEMPSHSHTNSPHSHSESGAVFAPNEIGVGVPTPTAVPSATITGGSSVSIDPTGGGLAHDNMPPYTAVVYGIVARF